MRTNQLALLISAVMGATALTACGDVANEGLTGIGAGAGSNAGAAGGAGGAGSNAGAGNGAGSDCPGVDPEDLGIAPVHGGWGPEVSGAMVVTTVTATSISMLGDDGEVTVVWAGADLSAAFAPGEPVTLDPPSATGGWYVVRGETHFAALMSQTNEIMFGAGPYACPLGGPEIALQRECFEWRACHRAYPEPCYYETYSLSIDAGGEHKVARTQELVAVGGFHVYNGGIVEQFSGFEPTQQLSFTVLGRRPSNDHRR